MSRNPTEDQLREMQERVAGGGIEAQRVINAVMSDLLWREASGKRSFFIDIEPMGAPRQSRKDAWDPRPVVVRYRAWKDALRASCAANGWVLGGVLSAVFYIPMPPSWSKKKRAEMSGMPHQQKPDIDNCAKAVMDSFNKDDGHVHTLVVSKRWAEHGRIELYF